PSRCGWRGQAWASERVRTGRPYRSLKLPRVWLRKLSGRRSPRIKRPFSMQRKARRRYSALLAEQENRPVLAGKLDPIGRRAADRDRTVEGGRDRTFFPHQLTTAALARGKTLGDEPPIFEEPDPGHFHAAGVDDNRGIVDPRRYPMRQVDPAPTRPRDAVFAHEIICRGDRDVGRGLRRSRRCSLVRGKIRCDR